MILPKHEQQHQLYPKLGAECILASLNNAPFAESVQLWHHAVPTLIR